MDIRIYCLPSFFFGWTYCICAWHVSGTNGWNTLEHCFGRRDRSATSRTATPTSDWIIKRRDVVRSKKAYAAIQRLFVHEAYPGGPRRYVLEGKWFKVVGVCPIANTTLVRYCPSMPFNTSSRFVFLDACYQRPVAIWPHDPLGDLPLGDRRKDWFDVIDRNQCESYE